MAMENTNAITSILEPLFYMKGAELFGKVLRCNIAKAMGKGPAGKAIWSADEWIKNHIQETGEEPNALVEDDE